MIPSPDPSGLSSRAPDERRPLLSQEGPERTLATDTRTRTASVPNYITAGMDALLYPEFIVQPKPFYVSTGTMEGPSLWD